MDEIIAYWRQTHTLPRVLTEQEIRQFWQLEEIPYKRKTDTVRAYAERFRLNTFIETGTWHGDMVEAMKSEFQRIISIELGLELYFAAKMRFAEHPHIRILHGDSGQVVTDVLRDVKEPCLFWLDGHYSEGSTARGGKDTPILLELENILHHSVQDHVILIDDARCFIGDNPVFHDYPTIPELQEFVKSLRSDVVFEVESDMIRIHP